MKKAFTLAEVLITLAIIGVVATMTIPTLIAKINSIVTENQAKVFNAKLIKGLNLTKTAGDLNDTYNSTYEFLTDGLGKNLKMAKICDSDHIRDCVPYDKIKYDKNNTEETINIKDIKTAAKLKLPAPYTDTAAFVLADGTPAIVSYNLKCIDDPDKADTEINSCLAGIYDLNGTHLPSASELAKIARVLYKDNSISDDNYSTNKDTGLNWNSNKVAVFSALGITNNSSSILLWSSASGGDSYAYYRLFKPSYTGYYRPGRGYNDRMAVCISE